MNKATKTAEFVRVRIEEMPRGEPFTPKAFLAGGTRAAVDQTLSRLTRSGEIERVSRGVYVRPETSRYVGKVAPELMKVVRKRVESLNDQVHIHGAEAARRLGLSTQMQTRPVYLTTGRTRSISAVGMEVQLQHVSQRKLVLGDTLAGLALSAMWYLGKNEVTPALVGEIHNQLGAGEFESLKSATHVMPAWMTDAIYRYERMIEGTHA